MWNIWDTLFGDIPWQPNMGDTMKGIRPEPTPVARTVFYPNPISQDPNKDVFETLESSEQMILRWHDYSTKIFSFLPSWQDFRDNQLTFNHKDVIRQIQVGNNIFIRTNVFDMSPNVFVAGAQAEFVTSAPVAAGNASQSAAASKNVDWIKDQVIKNIRTNLSYRVVKNAATVMAEDINAPFFEGAKNMPKPNEALKGKYVLIGSNEAWLQFDDDPDIIIKRDQMTNLADNDYQGTLANGRVLYKCDRFPLRFNDDGVFIAPQIVEMPSKKTRPNPAYNAAKYETAFIVGADAYRTVKVGPPPRDFTSMDKDKFYKMRWNGETRLTDQFLIVRGSIAGGDYDVQLNDDGRFLKIKGTTTHGIMPGERYNAMPIFYKRQRKASI